MFRFVLMDSDLEVAGHIHISDDDGDLEVAGDIDDTAPPIKDEQCGKEPPRPKRNFGFSFAPEQTPLPFPPHPLPIVAIAY